jgi:hypothetical protein
MDGMLTLCESLPSVALNKIGDNAMSDLHFIPEEVTPIPRRGLRLTTLMVWVLVIGGLAGVLGRAVRQAREAARASQCFCIKQIAVAFYNYHDTYGSFPPAYVADANGKPMHSWRVLILPFLEQSSLYSSYSMAEPWDGPNNRKLLDQRPSVYHCPSRDCGPTLTSYVAIVGPGTGFPGSTSTRISDIHDGTEQTILIAEVANVDILWTEPRDLDVRTMSWIINDPSKPSISSFHERAPTLLFADGSVRGFSKFPSPMMLKAMTTIDGHDPVDLEKQH